MPGRRRYRKPARKGTRRYGRKKMMRRGRRNPITLRSTRFTTGVPDRMVVRMTYEDVYNMAAPAARSWRLNSIFDPDYTGVGHQPRGRDQWASLYSSYRVFAVKAAFTVHNADANSGITVGLIPDNTTSVSYTSDYLSENPRARIIGLSAMGGGLSVKTIRAKYNIPHILGYTAAQYKNNEDCKCLMGVNPSETAFLTLVIQALGSYSGTTTNAQVRATFTFYVELLDRVELSAS